MTLSRKHVRRLKRYVETGLLTINEVRQRLGEPKLNESEAKLPLILTEEGRWLYLNKTSVNVDIQPLLPKAFAGLKGAAILYLPTRGQENE
ncbi:hypothetical protein HDF16_005129 [Granulicella aggregans]|uniref:Uncharacterized protein n=1 Tax=Granulicella aggregans TaxID=474949 RepID=A0A7W8E5Q8_9BACT|nr:hypothetical protein [Granulicella aggregans]MBB5060393.1 hypothetical protein [Granulicella aggregans]